VVAWEHVERHVQGRQRLADGLALGVGTVFGQVARDEHGVGRLRHRADRLDRGGEPLERVGVDPVGSDMGVAELHEQKGFVHSCA
jgi:hypothetical protein